MGKRVDFWEVVVGPNFEFDRFCCLNMEWFSGQEWSEYLKLPANRTPEASLGESYTDPGHTSHVTSPKDDELLGRGQGGQPVGHTSGAQVKEQPVDTDTVFAKLC